MNQLNAIAEQALSLARLAARVLLAVIVLAALARLMGINIPYVRVNDGNLQALAAFVAAAAYAMR